jgi:uncharacterized protein YbjT (DUF2867 family)
VQISVGNKTAVIVGASGVVGGHLINYLLASQNYSKVVSLARRKLDIESDKLVQHVINFDKYGTYAPLVKGDDLYLTIGTTMAKAKSKEAFKKVDYTYALNIAKAASDNGMNQLMLVSSVGADSDSVIFYSRVKGELEDAIKELVFWSIHIFRPSILLGERPESRAGESIAKVIGKGLDFVLGGLLSKYKPVEAETVAKAMVAKAQELDAGIHIYPSHWIQKLSEKEDALRKI